MKATLQCPFSHTWREGIKRKTPLFTMNEKLTTPGGNHSTSENPPAPAAEARILGASTFIPTDPTGLIRPSVLGNISQLNGITTQNEVSETQENVNASANSGIISRLNMFEKMCENLQKQVEHLKKENQLLKDSLNANGRSEINLSKPVTENVMDYHTDEEELARETDWILCKGKKKASKKRKAESSPDIESVSVPIVKPKPKVKANKPKLPPVILSNIKDFSPVQNLMCSQNIKYEMKLLNNNQLSITVTSEDDYRTLTKAINTAKFEWHSYENKATRPCKVIVRGLHPTCKPEIIIEDLKQSGFNILGVVNLTKKKKENDKQTVEQLPLFMLTFDHSEDIKKIFSISHIVSIKVKIEAIRKPRNQIPQCKRCQRFEHTQAFCKREARCVKCGGTHLTIECKLDKKAPPKCCNCQEAHPANYRGCVVAKELQKRRAVKKKAEVPKPQIQKPNTPTISKKGSYAEVVRKSSVTPMRQKTQKKITIKDNPMTPLDLVLQKLEELSKRLSKIEAIHANRQIGTPRNILKK